ncbi:MAG: D-amino acid dehydrogenase [Gammaproteobacteria bacterium]
MKIIVMGSGVIGVTTAYYLARDGHEVKVLDRRNGPAQETSFANAGLVAPGHAYAWASPAAPKILFKSLYRADQSLKLKLRADPRMWSWFRLFLRNCTAEKARVNSVRKLRLCVYSREALHDVVTNTGVAFERRDGGALYLYRNRAAFDAAVAHSAILRDNGIALETLDPAQAAARDPALETAKRKLVGALYSPIDESGDARMFTCALAERCEERLGVKFVFDTKIQRLDASGQNIERIVTDKGDFRADIYVLALGCDSPFLARPLGIRLPIYPVKGYSATLPIGGRNAAPAMGGVDEENLVAYSRLGDRLRLTGTAEFSGYARGHRREDFDSMLSAARDLFPDAADYSRPSYWAGLRPMTPHGAPIIGKTPYRNLHLNTGHGHMGWTMSCGSARIAADIIAGRKPDIDVEGMTL